MRIDARGMRCPWPALRLAKALRDERSVIDILADDPIAPRELAAVAAHAGRNLREVDIHHFRVSAA